VLTAGLVALLTVGVVHADESATQPAQAPQGRAEGRDGEEEVDTIRVRDDSAWARQRRPPAVDDGRILLTKKITRTSLDALPAIPQGQPRQVLALTPGLLVSEVTNLSWNSISYRGLGEPHESWNLLTLRDGVPLVPDLYSYPAAYVAPPNESVAGVEFLRGGASLLYGPQPGGALNYLSRNPRTDRQWTAMARGYGGGYGAYGVYASMEGTMRDGLRPVSYLLDVQTSGLSGMRSRNADASSVSANASVVAPIDERTRVTLRFEAYRGEFGEAGGLTRDRYTADRTQVSTPFDRLRIERFAPWVGLEHRLGPTTTLRTKVWGASYVRASQRQAGTAFGVESNPDNVSIVQTQTFATLGAESRLEHSYEAFGRDQTFTLGTLFFGSYAPVRVDKGLTALDRDGLGTALARSLRHGYTFAAFGEHLFRFGALRIVPGFRADVLRQSVAESLDLAVGDATDGTQAGPPNGELGRRDSVEPVFLPGLGIAYELPGGLEPYANATRGYKPKLFNDGLTFQSGINVAPAFAPTYTTTLEAGVRGSPLASVYFDVSAFWIRFDDAIGLLGNDQGGAQRTNVGRMGNRGLDVALEWDALSVLGDVAKSTRGRLLVYGNASLLDATFETGPTVGTRPQYAPPYLVRTGVIYRRAEDLKLSLLGTFVGKHNAADNAHPLFEIPAYDVWDLGAEARIPGTPLSALGGINNLFDSRYFARIRPGGGGGIDPAFGRQAYVGLTGRL
jgi:Fe(3+) dicitrate transport protein